MRAWIVKWEWIGDHAAVVDPIINILSARLSPEEVRKYVERCYASRYYSLDEQIAQAHYNKPYVPGYPAQFDAIEGHVYTDYISCGHNPFIQAFKANGVRNSETKGVLLWDEDSVRQDRTRFLTAVKKHNH